MNSIHFRGECFVSSCLIILLFRYIDYKWARGFDPALIHSTHYICHPGLRRAVSHFLEYETENNVELREYLNSRSSVASKDRTNRVSGS